MKRILLLFLFSVVIGLTGTQAQQDIPNGDFENWANPAAPDGWDLVDGKAERFSQFVNGADTIKAYSGSYFLGLRTDTMNGGQFYRGTLAMKYPFTERPDMIQGYFMFLQGEPTVPENFGISVALTRWNTTANHRDTIAYNNRSGPGNNLYPWNVIKDSMVYTNTGNPDSAHIFIFSSRANTVSINTWLFVDKLEFITGPSGIAEQPQGNILNLNLYPNPANEHAKLSLNLSKPSMLEVRVLDVMGREVKNVYNGNCAAGQNTIDMDLTGLKQGIYFYQLKAGESVNMYKFVISR